MAIAGAIVGGAALGAASGLGSTALQAYFNAGESAKARKFAKHMYKHRYRYAVKDMRGAGLNPILAGGGGGAGMPSVPPPARIDRPDLGGGLQAASALSQLKLQQSQRNLLNAQARKAGVEAEALERMGLGAQTYPGKIADSLRGGVIDIVDLMTGETDQKGVFRSTAFQNFLRGRPAKCSWRIKIPADTKRSGYSQSLPSNKYGGNRR